VSRRRLSSAIALAALLACAMGFAQAETTPKVVPPAITTPAAVQYPETAIAERYFADVEVVLVIDVDKSGAVTKATPVSQAGYGFDDVAIASAANLRARLLNEGIGIRRR
jgi:outer membrane biosynthesis protein TonB